MSDLRLYDITSGPTREQISRALLYGEDNNSDLKVVFRIVTPSRLEPNELGVGQRDYLIQVQSVTRFHGAIWNILGKVELRTLELGTYPSSRFETIHVEYSFINRTGRVLRLGNELIGQENRNILAGIGVWELYFEDSKYITRPIQKFLREEDARVAAKKLASAVKDAASKVPGVFTNYTIYIKHPNERVESFFKG